MQTQQTRTGAQFLTTTIGPDDIFTREDLTDEQRLFGQTAAEFMRGEVLPRESRLFAHDWTLTRELLRKAADLDLMRLEIPEAYGGLGLTKISAAYVGEQIAMSPSFAGSLGAHTSIGTLPLVYFGTEAQKAKYLPRLASGELVAAYALTEPQSGSDALAARTTAVLSEDGRHYLLNGQKMWITNGGFADLFTIFAKVDGEKFTAFLVERGMGVVSGADEKKLGLDGSSTTALMLDNVRVPVDNVLGTIGEGHKVAFNILNMGRVKLGTRNISGAKNALNNAVRYACDRRQFGRAIAEFGLIKRKIAEMAIRCFTGDAMVYRALGDVDRALEAVDPADSTAVLKTIEGFAVECSINKVYTSEALAYVVDEALQVFGGNGYSREFPAERPYRDARITRIYEGTNEINRLIIPTRLLKQWGSESKPYVGPSFSSGVGASFNSGATLTARPEGRAYALPTEWALLASAKTLANGMLTEAVAAYGESLKEEQEVLADIADVMIEVYAVESTLARAEKLWRVGAELPPSPGPRRTGAPPDPGRPRSAPTRREEAATVALDIARVQANDAAERIARSAREVRRALPAQPRGSTLTDLIAPIASFAGTDGVAARRRIADAVTAAGKYPF